MHISACVPRDVHKMHIMLVLLFFNGTPNARSSYTSCKVKSFFYLNIFSAHPALPTQPPLYLPERNLDPATCQGAAALSSHSLSLLTEHGGSSGSHWFLLLSIKACELGWGSATLCVLMDTQSAARDLTHTSFPIANSLLLGHSAGWRSQECQPRTPEEED